MPPKEITKQRAQNMQMKMPNAELYLKGATAIYGFSKINRTSVEVRDETAYIIVKSFHIDYIPWVSPQNTCTLACAHTGGLLQFFQDPVAQATTAC